MTQLPSDMTLLADSYETVYQPNILRTQFESGAIKQRRQQSQNYKVHNAIYSICGQDALDEFYRWINEDINGGASWFLWSDPTQQGKLVRARLDGSDISVKPQTSRFDMWEINLVIEVFGE